MDFLPLSRSKGQVFPFVRVLGGVVSVGRKVSHHGARVLENLVFVPVLESELLGGMWINSGYEAGPRGVANRDIAMCLSEGYPALDKLSQVWSFDLGMTAERLDAIVQVVTDDEQDVRFICPGERKCSEGEQ